MIDILPAVETREQELLMEVRQTRTLDGNYPLYQFARISLQEFNPNELYPTALYTLTPNKQRLYQMQEKMERRGLDMFDLGYKINNGIGIISPPVVEMSDGVPAIVDGIHRISMAREQQRPIKVILVDGVDSNYPIISYPVGWNSVLEYETKPEDPELLRRMRVTDTDGSIRRYFRDLSYLGSTGRRKRDGQ